MYENPELLRIGRETVAILENGSYRLPAARLVSIAGPLAVAVAGTVLHEPDDPLPVGSRGGSPQVTVTGETTLAALARLARGGEVAALNFASARTPGGGFLRGTEAQEESLARSSGLYACLTKFPQFYADHRAAGDQSYSDRIIYSPGVPFFRGDGGGLLRNPYLAAIVTAAAPNLAELRDERPDLVAGVPDVLRRRAARVLDVFAAHGHRRIVVGAWGCGVFGNDPVLVAGIFKSLVDDRFDEVVHAVHDSWADRPVYRAFADAHPAT